MKRIKMMLLSFALLAVVGGALAFKAKFQLFPYCTTVISGNTFDCELVQARTTLQGPQVLYTPAVEHPETGEIGCTTIDENGQDVAISCATLTSTTIVE